MSISRLSDDFQKGLIGFLWDEWGQMGVSTDSRRRDDWAMDPEALLLLTFEVARAEPRLLEEVLDWMLANEKLISVQRLRNLAEGEADRALVEAVLGWLGQNRRRTRLGARSEATRAEEEPRPFFRGSRLPIAEPDPAFLAQGFLKPRTEPTGKSQAPDIQLPINLAFRLRLLLGIGVRAEVIRVLLTTTNPKTPWMNAQALAASTAYTKRNVQEALASLAADDFVSFLTVGNENRYGIDRDRWAKFLQLDAIPQPVDWPQLTRTFRRILRWLVDPTNQGLSEYMLLSGARTLLEEIQPDLHSAGFPVSPGDSTRDLPRLESFVRDLGRNVLSVDL